MQGGNTRTRRRASKACHRCNQRKIKCDAMQVGLPCTRCRMDHVSDCTLIASRRGIYDRKKARRHQTGEQTVGSRSTQHVGTPRETRVNLRSAGADTNAPTRTSNCLRGNVQPEGLEALGSVGSSASSSHLSPDSIPGNSSIPPGDFCEGESSNSAPRECALSKESSLASMFEAFLKQRNESTPERHGIVLLGEPSPLTFALEELQRGRMPRLHDVSGEIHESASMTVDKQDTHPPHLEECDIVYLKAKGAFEFPEDTMADALMKAYLERFHPLYSIVKKAQLERAYREKKLPWILLHAVCFIGATFCDSAVIHQSSFKSRLEARQFYYAKSKVLFTVGYETDKIVLLKAVIMLSFCGPLLKHYWNPGSWTGFGVTLAVSLGIHRAAGSVRTHSREDTKMLRRLFWTLSVRDAYVSALLGRSFRLNMSLCDTGPLTCDDFEDDAQCSHAQQSDCNCKQPILYQIHMTRLSLTLRNILLHRFGPGRSAARVEELHAQLMKWQSELPRSLNWSQHKAGLPIFSVILKILFHYHIILLHMARPEQVASSPAQIPCNETHSAAVAESAASAIASTAVTIMTKSVICALPHEIFPAFFLAGILLYRQTRQADPAAAEKAQASLDNCQIVLNEAGECWDPGNWTMKLLEFLQSNSCGTDDTQNRVSREEIDTHDNQPAGLGTVAAAAAHSESMYPPLADPRYDISTSLDASAAFDASLSAEFGDFMLMPTYWLHSAEDWPNFES